MATRRQQHATRCIAAALQAPESRERTFAERLSDLLITPWFGVPVLLLVLYLGLFKFVGGLGAGVVVDFLERTVFDGHISPFVDSLTSRAIPWPALRDLIGGEYGVITLGFRYALAIILPIVTFFFVVFAIMEDTGYLPRLALLVDRVFKRIGLSGRGVIPIVLGFGCDTMATMVTRTLPTLRERVIATLLLALAVPCSAQLGLILAILHGRPLALAVWGGVLAAVFLLTGFLAARLMPGEIPHFYMELPPLRLPKLSNVLVKTYTRVHWYLKEVIPLFLLASVLIWLGHLSGLFHLAVRGLTYPVRWIGLPDEAATVFLYGFFRRDYGAAGLYDLNSQQALTGVQLTVATIALTLFLPCIAQFLVNVKERGWKVGVGVSVFVLFFSFAVAYVVNLALHVAGVRL
jgi:ferrous iron transport protein B